MVEHTNDGLCYFCYTEIEPNRTMDSECEILYIVTTKLVELLEGRETFQ